jgi:hypothetical protein
VKTRSFFFCLILILLQLVVGCGDSQQRDVRFARETFESLAQGNTEVADKIDWPVFTALGDNLGVSYTALPTEVEKQRFTTQFITQFAASFRESGGNVDQFTHWRSSYQDSQKTEVSADSPNGILTLTVSERDKVRRVSAIHLTR